MNWYVISVLAHILAAVVWIGGMLFLFLVLVPVTRNLQPPATRAQVIGAVGKRFLPIAWLCIGLLLITGTVNLHYRGISLGQVLSWNLPDTQFGRVLAVKLGVVLSIILLSALHDFVLGPRLTHLMETMAHPAVPGTSRASPPTAISRPRRLLSLLARLNLLLALSALALGVMLVRGLP